MAEYCLPACSAFSLIAPRTASPGVGCTTQSQLGPLAPTLNQENGPQACPQANPVGDISQMRFSFQNGNTLCQVGIQLAIKVEDHSSREIFGISAKTR